MHPLARPHAFRLRGLPAILVLLVASACSGGPQGSDSVIQVSFTDAVSVVAVSGEEPAADPPGAQDEGRAIVALITDWYQKAFVDPAGWRDPAFPDVVGLFTGDARDRVRDEIASVTIGRARTEVRSVIPDAADVKVTLYYDGDGLPAYAIADVSFVATAALKARGNPLTISQKGTYFMRRVDDAWRIFSYQARNDQAQNPPGATTP